MQGHLILATSTLDNPIRSHIQVKKITNRGFAYSYSIQDETWGFMRLPSEEGDHYEQRDRRDYQGLTLP